MAFPFFMMFSRKLNFHEKLMPEYLVQFQMLRQKNCIGKIENIISLLKGLFIMGQWVYIEDIDENDSRENVEEQIAELQTTKWGREYINTTRELQFEEEDSYDIRLLKSTLPWFIFNMLFVSSDIGIVISSVIFLGIIPLLPSILWWKAHFCLLAHRMHSSNNKIKTRKTQ